MIMSKVNFQTNKVQHHPQPELLLNYVSGKLSPAMSIVVALHQKRCQQCQAQIAELEAVGGEAIMNPVSTNQQQIEDSLQDNFAKLMATIEQTPSDESGIGDDNEASVFDLALASEDLDVFTQINELKIGRKSWQRVSRKIWRTQFDLPDEKFQLEVLKFAPYAKIPKHTHEGEEITQILQGAFSDQDGEYQAGEFLIRNSQHEHQPVAGPEGCICVAVTNAPLKFTGLLGPILNFFTR
jgi:putative transcriptional regulator